MLKYKSIFTLLVTLNLVACGSKETAAILEAELEGKDCSNSALVGPWLS